MNRFKKFLIRFRNPFHTLTSIEKEILWRISAYIANHYPTKIANKDFIDYIGIKNIRFKRNKLHLELQRPGVFIGPKGKLIDEITNMLKETFNKNIKIYIYESKMENYFYYEYMSDINV